MILYILLIKCLRFRDPQKRILGPKTNIDSTIYFSILFYIYISKFFEKRVSQVTTKRPQLTNDSINYILGVRNKVALFRFSPPSKIGEIRFDNADQ